MKIRLNIILFVAIGLCTVISCKKNQPSPASFIVEGAVDSTMNGYKAYLYDYNSEHRLDSTVVKDGKFAFKGTADSIRYSAAFVEINGVAQTYINFISESGEISLDLKNRKISGTPLNDAYSHYMTQQEKVYDKTPEYISLLDKTLESNTDNILGAIVLIDMSYFYSTKQMDTAIAKLNKNITDLRLLKPIIERNELLRKTDIGQKFTDFTIDQPDGTKKSLSDYAGKGKYLLVDFWASWCHPCRAEGPNLKEIYKKHKGDKFELLGIAVWDEVEKTKKAIKDDAMTWPQILDAKEIPTKLYSINSIPHIILIGPDGTILARGLRGEEMKAKIDEVLK